eukprot:190142_1
MSLLRLRQTNNLLRQAQHVVPFPVRNHPKLLFYKTNRYFSSDIDIEQIVVPNLGDSITEGTVTSIHKQIGDKVATDEVVLEIETDKVSVDIRAPQEGYIAAYFAAIDEDVAVGGALYGLSAQPLDGVDTSSIKLKPPKSTQIPSPSPPPSQTQTQATLSASTATITHRVPMIQFRHGVHEDLDKTTINGISTPQTNVMEPLNENAIPFWELPQELRRTEFNEWDIDAVNTGGANL